MAFCSMSLTCLLQHFFQYKLAVVANNPLPWINNHVTPTWQNFHDTWKIGAKTETEFYSFFASTNSLLTFCINVPLTAILILPKTIDTVFRHKKVSVSFLTRRLNQLENKTSHNVFTMMVNSNSSERTKKTI